MVSAATAPGNDSVREALERAAAEMLGEVGPRAISVREVAKRAGVNHGQVHHYFGRKRGLLRAAMRHLSIRHFDFVRERAAGEPFPPALSVGEDPAYWRALCHAVMAGDLELARVEVDEDISVPQRALRTLLERRPGEDAGALKALLLTSAALQLGFVAFEPFLWLVGDVADDAERQALRRRVKRIAEDLVLEAAAKGRARDEPL